MNAANRAGDALEAALVRRLNAIYAAALEAITDEIADFLRRIADIDKGKIKPPKAYDTPEKIKKWREGFTRELMRKYAVQQRIMDEINRVGAQARASIQQSMADMYELNREAATRKIAGKTLGVSFAQYDRRQIEIILRDTQPPFSKIAYENLGKNPAIVRRLQNEMAQATILGESQAKVIKRIIDVVGNASYNARRTAQTERTRIQSQARAEALHEAAEKGVITTKEWSARMVNTRDSHAKLDGQVVREGEKFVTIWGNELEYPGDPSAPAKEVINCHCVLIPDVLLPGETLDANGSTVERSDLKAGRFDGIIDYSKAVFAGKRDASWHFEKHKAEFPGYTEAGYLEAAWKLMQSPLSDGVLEEMIRGDGSVSRYHFRDNLFISTTADGQIRTFFRPEKGAEYWIDEHKRNK